MEIQGNQKNILSWVVVVAFIYAIYKLFVFLGVFKSKEEQGKEELNKELAGKGDVFVKMAKEIAVTPAVLKRSVSDSKTIAKMIATLREAPSVWWLPDNEIKVYAVFRALKSKLDMGLLAAVFKVSLKIDLFDYLEQFMNEDELAKVNSIVKGLPAKL
jgi:hypothetical protein